MAKQYKTPGVYIKEKNTFGSNIMRSDTAIPVFIGFTEYAKTSSGEDLKFVGATTIVREPVLVKSISEYETAFGRGDKTGIIELTKIDDSFIAENKRGDEAYVPGYMHPSVLNFFANGGGSCYIISVGKYEDFNLVEMPEVIKNQIDVIKRAIELAETITLVLPTDFIRFGAKNYYWWAIQFANLSGEEKKFFTILDVVNQDANSSVFNEEDIKNYRASVNSDYPSYIGAYYPFLKSVTAYSYKEDLSNVYLNGNPVGPELTSEESQSTLGLVKAFLKGNYINMPPSPFMAGIYSRLDKDMGVWTPPANISPMNILGPVVNLTHGEQEGLNVDIMAGKSVNAIRSFTGRGTLVWGARTNDGNGMDWRYVNVRRLFISMETDISKGLQAFVFKPNVHITWVEVKAVIENYLRGLFMAGAFVGASPEESYQVYVGLGETMTTEDVLNGFMHVLIQVAPIRPAEFIELRFTQLLSS